MLKPVNVFSKNEIGLAMVFEYHGKYVLLHFFNLLSVPYLVTKVHYNTVQMICQVGGMITHKKIFWSDWTESTTHTQTFWQAILWKVFNEYLHISHHGCDKSMIENLHMILWTLIDVFNWCLTKTLM